MTRRGAAGSRLHPVIDKERGVTRGVTFTSTDLADLLRPATIALCRRFPVERNEDARAQQSDRRRPAPLGQLRPPPGCPRRCRTHIDARSLVTAAWIESGSQSRCSRSRQARRCARARPCAVSPWRPDRHPVSPRPNDCETRPGQRSCSSSSRRQDRILVPYARPPGSVGVVR